MYQKNKIFKNNNKWIMIIAVICYIIAIVKPLKLIIGQKYESDTDDWQWRKPNMNTVVY